MLCKKRHFSGRCLRLLVVLLCLRDFLAARAIVELFDRTLLAADVGLHLCNRELEGNDGCTFLSKLLHPAHLLKNCCTFRLL